MAITQSLEQANSLLKQNGVLDQARQQEIMKLLTEANDLIKQQGYPLDKDFFNATKEFVELLTNNPLVKDNADYAKLARAIGKYSIFVGHLEELKKVVTNTLTSYEKILRQYLPKIRTLKQVQPGSTEEKTLNECEAYLRKIVDFNKKLAEPEEYVARKIAADNPIKETLLAQQLLMENDFYKVLLEFNQSATKLEKMLGADILQKEVFTDEQSGTYFASQCIKTIQFLTRIPLMMQSNNGKDYLTLLNSDNPLRQNCEQLEKDTAKYISAANEFSRTQTLKSFLEENIRQSALLESLTYDELQYLLSDKSREQNSGSRIIVLSDGEPLNMSGGETVSKEVLKKLKGDLTVFNDNLKLETSLSKLTRLSTILPEISILKINTAYKAFIEGKLSRDEFVTRVNKELKNINEKLSNDEKKQIKQMLKTNVKLAQDKSNKALPVVRAFKEMSNAHKEFAPVYTELLEFNSKTLQNLNNAFLSWRKGDINEEKFIEKLAGNIGKKIVKEHNAGLIKALSEIKSQAEKYSSKNISNEAIDKLKIAWDEVEDSVTDFMRKHAKDPHALSALARLLSVAGVNNKTGQLETVVGELNVQGVNPIAQHDLTELNEQIATVKAMETSELEGLLKRLREQPNNVSAKREKLVVIAAANNPVVFTVLAQVNMKDVPIASLEHLINVINARITGATNDDVIVNMHVTCPAVIETGIETSAIAGEIARQDQLREIVANADPRVKNTAQQFATIASADTNIKLNKEQAAAILKILSDLANDKIKIRQFNDKLAGILKKPLEKKAKENIISAYQNDIQQRLNADPGYKSISNRPDKITAVNEVLRQLSAITREFNKGLKQPLFKIGKKAEAKLTPENAHTISNTFATMAEISQTITLLQRSEENQKLLNSKEKNAPVAAKHWSDDVKKMQGSLIKLEAAVVKEMSAVQIELEHNIAKLQKQQIEAIKRAEKADKAKKPKDKDKEMAKVRAIQDKLTAIKNERLDDLKKASVTLQNIPTASDHFKERVGQMYGQLERDRNDIQKHFNEYSKRVDYLSGTKTSTLDEKAIIESLQKIQQRATGTPATAPVDSVPPPLPPRPAN